MMTPKQILALLKHDHEPLVRVRRNPTGTRRKQSVTVSKTKRGLKFCRTISKSETKQMANLFDSVRGNPRKSGGGWYIDVAGTKYHRAFENEAKAMAHGSKMKAGKYHLRVVWITSPSGKNRQIDGASRSGVSRARARKPYQVESRLGFKRFADHGLAAAHMLSLKNRGIAYRATGPNGPLAIFSPGTPKPISDAEIRRRYERGVLEVKRKGGGYSAFGVITAALYRAHGKRRVQHALAPLRANAARKAVKTRRANARSNPVITFDLTPDEMKSWNDKSSVRRKIIIGQANSTYAVSGSSPVVIAYQGEILATRTGSGWRFT